LKKYSAIVFFCLLPYLIRLMIWWNLINFVFICLKRTFKIKMVHWFSSMWKWARIARLIFYPFDFISKHRTSNKKDIILSHFSTQLDSSFWVHSKKKYVSRIGKKTFSLRSTNIYTRVSHQKHKIRFSWRLSTNTKLQTTSKL
jgi:hypothetical protein